MKNRVVFYSKKDISMNWQCERIIEVFHLKEKWKEFDEINDIIELYQVMLMFETDICPAELTDYDWEECKKAVDNIKKIVAKRFSRIEDITLEIELNNVEKTYKKSFWEILMAFGGEKRISALSIERLLNNEKINILDILVNKQAVKTYGDVVKRYLQKNIHYAHLLVDEYLKKNEDNYINYFFPSEMTIADKVEIINKYIDYTEANMNDLKILSVSRGNNQLPISSRMRLKAQDRFEQKKEQLSKTGISIFYGIGITFKEQDELTVIKIDGRDRYLSYDVNWIFNNMDYPTLFNNFIYMFDFVDLQYRWNHVSKKSMCGTIEQKLISRGKREYLIGGGYHFIEMMAQDQTRGYLSLLEEKGVFAEDMIKWFFETYLLKEFNAQGFIYNASLKTSKILDKCRNIAIEIDSVLKQYRLFCEDGFVNRKLFEISTEHLFISAVPSQLKEKYIYPIKANLNRIFYLLFSDQSLMFYKKDRCVSKTAHEVLVSEKINYNELKYYQCEQVDYLIEKGILGLDKENTIVFSNKLLFVLFDLYMNEFICINYYGNYADEIDFLINNGFISKDSSLLSVSEQNYYNFIFNNADYDNSKDLRNKYAHGNQSLNENEMYNDYFTMLRMMILIILKINEEFCLIDFIKH